MIFLDDFHQNWPRYKGQTDPYKPDRANSRDPKIEISLLKVWPTRAFILIESVVLSNELFTIINFHLFEGLLASKNTGVWEANKQLR